MAVFKCKMCGGTIEFEPGATVGICDSCGTKQTLPRLDDDKKANLYDRANHFRRNNDFDKAAGIYEQILTEDNTDAEAYWSLVLCRYGIEYVEDPATHKHVPTVNRAQFTSIFDDDNYKSALHYADAAQREVYESEAKSINAIQKNILTISQQEQPFDVFICYKETDANGRRTPDSVLANDLYHQLTQEGFKVFFSRITLEDKLGTAYEPYIFAALNSAKVMVVLGTKPEHFNAVWVRNEWSRYLALVKTSNGKKVLIPAYKDMDPYELPDEFSHLQAQDMSKLGFTQDLIRGIRKILTIDAPKPAGKETVVVNSEAGNMSSLLERAFMFLEDGEWKSADEYCERVLDMDPKNARAYLGKLMAELQVRKQEQLADVDEPFDDRNNYQKTIRFADVPLRKKLEGDIEHILSRNEHNRLEGIYEEATARKDAARTESDYQNAASIFASIADYRDASEQERNCLELAEKARKEAIYSEADSLASGRDISAINEAIEKYRSIPDWKDALEKVHICQNRIETIKVEDEKKQLQDKIERAAQTKKTIKFCAIAAACIIVLAVVFKIIIPSIKYGKANATLADGDYLAAMEAFADIDGFRDSHKKRTEAFCTVKNQYKEAGDRLLENGDRIQAAVNYIKAGEPVLAKRTYDFSTKIAASWAASAAVTESNSLLFKSNRSELDNPKYSDISAITDFDEYDGITGLTSSGQVVRQGRYIPNRDEVASWSGVKQLCLTYYQAFALLNNGTVACVYEDPDDDDYFPVAASVSSWENIVEIGVHNNDLWGIDSNGQLRYAGVNSNGSAHRYGLSDFSSVKKVVFVHEDYHFDWLIGLTLDGDIVCSKDWNFSDNEPLPEELTGFTQKAVDILTQRDWVFILQEDGRVLPVFIDTSSKYSDYSSYVESIRSEIEKWENIVYIQSVEEGIIAEDIYGNVFYQSTDYSSQKTGEDSSKYFVVSDSDIESAIEGWKDIVYISSYIWEYGYSESKNVLGIHSDGTVSSLGTGEYLTLERDGKSKDILEDDYHAEHHKGGTYDKVGDWKLW